LPANAPLTIAGETVAPGERRYIDLPLPPLYTHTSVSMPVHVFHGKQAGPVLGITAVVHGDEINGIEIIRRLLKIKALSRMQGTLIAVPVVNVYGFVTQERYLPDRRDLNRSFPGSDRGSMASRLADILLTEIIDKCTHVIDLHTAAAGRINLPQIRVDIDSQSELLNLAKAFAPPLILDSQTRHGTLRAAVKDKPLLLYEAGEALRFDDTAIKAGVQGALKVMRYLGMLPKGRRTEKSFAPYVARDSVWMRAPQSGIVRSRKKLGAIVDVGTVLGVIADPFGESELEVESTVSGVLIGMTMLPLVHEGEALFHVASTKSTERAARAIDGFQQAVDEGLGGDR